MTDNSAPLPEQPGFQSTESSDIPAAGSGATDVVDDDLRPVGAQQDQASGHETVQPPQIEYRFNLSPPPSEPTPDAVEAARKAPKTWIAMVDPAWTGDTEAPEWAIVGWWRSGISGNIESWRENSAYQPSPRALGYPDPTDPIDSAVQLASTGYGTSDDVVLKLATAEVAVFIESDGTPVFGAAPDNTSVLPIYTAMQHAQAAGRLLFDVRTVSDLVTELPPEHKFYINPTGPVSMLVETESLLIELDRLAGGSENVEPPSSVAGQPLMDAYAVESASSPTQDMNQSAEETSPKTDKKSDDSHAAGVQQ